METGPVPLPIQTEMVYDLSYDQVWDQLVRGLGADKGIKFDDKESGVIGITRAFSDKEIWSYVDIGKWTKHWSSWKSFKAKTNLIVQSVAPAKTNVKVNSVIVGYRSDSKGSLSYASEYTLPSNGKLEREYLNLVAN